MSVDVALRHTKLARRAKLRELAGHAEIAVRDISTRSAIQLIDDVLADDVESLRPGQAGELPAADRDQILSVVQRNLFGDRVESTVGCSGCGKPFNVSFSLTALNAHVMGAAPGSGTGGTLQLSDGRLARLPVGRDECALVGLPTDEAERKLLESCLDELRPEDNTAALAAAMDSSAPMLALDLAARCPECGHDERITFDVQSFLLGSLINERPVLLRDIHVIARTYHWTLDEILSLNRSDRRAFATIIDAQGQRHIGRLPP